MRVNTVIQAVGDSLGTLYTMELWDAERPDAVRPFYTLSWRTTDTTKVDGDSFLAHARHIAYVAYSRIGAELAESERRRPLGL